MAAHLDPTLLRRHALPAHFMAGDRPAASVSAPGLHAEDGGSARLRATWQLGEGGQPLCGWSLDPAEPAPAKAGGAYAAGRGATDAAPAAQRSTNLAVTIGKMVRRLIQLAIA